MTTFETGAGGLLEALLRGVADGIVIQDRSGTIVECNGAAERILGLTRDQLAGRTSTDPRWAAIHEDGTPFPGETHPAMVCLRTGEPQRGVVMGVRLPAGGDRWISVSSEPVWAGRDSGPVGVVSVFTEITDQRRAQAAHAEAELRYRWMAEHVSDVLWTMDPATLRYTYVSPSITRLRGLTVEEALVEPIERSLTPEALARALAYREAFIIAEATGPGETELLTDVFEQPRADGTIASVEITVTAVRGADGRITSILGVSRDVTERVTAERAREETVVRLREALAKVRTLSGLLPICMYCKRVRTDEGYWDRIESYLAAHTDALLSHGLCPDCYRTRVPADLREEADAEPPMDAP